MSEEPNLECALGVTHARKPRADTIWTGRVARDVAPKLAAYSRRTGKSKCAIVKQALTLFAATLPDVDGNLHSDQSVSALPPAPAHHKPVYQGTGKHVEGVKDRLRRYSREKGKSATFRDSGSLP